VIPRTLTAGRGDRIPHPTPFGRARGASTPVLRPKPWSPSTFQPWLRPWLNLGLLSFFSSYFFIYCPSRFDVDLSRHLSHRVKSTFLQVVNLSRPDDIQSRRRVIGTGDSHRPTSSQSHRPIIPLPRNGNRKGKLRGSARLIEIFGEGRIRDEYGYRPLSTFTMNIHWSTMNIHWSTMNIHWSTMNIHCERHRLRLQVG